MKPERLAHRIRRKQDAREKRLRCALDRLSNCLLDIDEAELRRDVEAALRSIEKIYETMTSKR